MSASEGRTRIAGLVVVAFLLGVFLHVWILPEYFPLEPFAAAPYLLLGWLSVTLVFYGLARLLADPATLPSMRGADYGAALFLITLLLAGFAEFHGVSPRYSAAGYLVYALGIYPGLALFGWAIGKRTKAINRIASESGRGEDVE